MKKLTLEEKVARRMRQNATACDPARLGTRVLSITQLAALACGRRAVLCLNCWGLLPAAVVMNMTASSVLRAIDHEGIFLYNRAPKKFLVRYSDIEVWPGLPVPPIVVPINRGPLPPAVVKKGEVEP